VSRRRRDATRDVQLIPIRSTNGTGWHRPNPLRALYSSTVYAFDLAPGRSLFEFVKSGFPFFPWYSEPETRHDTGEMNLYEAIDAASARAENQRVEDLPHDPSRLRDRRWFGGITTPAGPAHIGSMSCSWRH